jgi:radical SAM superfamily enzyme YgiQ (UPF0313 family)
VELLDLDMALDQPYTLDLCCRISKRGIGTNWETDFRAEKCNDVLIPRTVDAGCSELLIGVESFDDGSLKQMKKSVSERMLLEAVDTCARYRLDLYFTFMIGFPWDTAEVLEKTYDFCRSNLARTTNFGVGYVIPERGTPLFDTFVREGLINVPITCLDYERAKRYPLAPTKHLNREELAKYWKKFKQAKLTFKRLGRSFGRHRLGTGMLVEGLRKFRRAYWGEGV